MTAHAAAASRCSAAACPAEDFGRHAGVEVEPVKETLALRRQQPLAAHMQVFARRPGEPADGVLAEDCLQQPLAHDGGAAGDADLEPRQARSHGEHHDHERGAEAVDAEGQPPGLRAFALALGADELHQACPARPGSRPPRCPRTPGCSREVIGAQQLPARGVRTPALVRVLGGVGGFIDDDGLQSRFDGGFHPDCRRRFAPEERAHAVPEAADVLLQARKNSPVPTKSCHRASTSPRSRAPSRVASRILATAS